jgi:dihydropteroate synthase
MHWQTRDRKLEIERPLVMGVLNVTPDSFSDGGQYYSFDDAIERAEQMIADGADIIDIGGESSRPGSSQVIDDEEIARVAPVVEAIAKRLDVPISVDTYKSSVARAAIAVGASIVNDISAFRFDAAMPATVAELKTGVVLMHSRGTFQTLHSSPPADDIFVDVREVFRRAIDVAHSAGIADEAIVLDIGIGFGKTLEQNLQLISGVDRLIKKFPQYPLLIGTSRKSFIGKLLGSAPVDQRLEGSLTTAAIAVWNGVRIVRTHDIKETSAALKIVDALCQDSLSS